MPPRRSARLNRKEGVVPIDAAMERQPVSLPPQPIGRIKRKSTMPESNSKVKSAKRGQHATSTANVETEATNQSHGSHETDKLSDLPPEIFSMVLINVTERAALSRLSRTCKRYYTLITPRLYERISVAAVYHAHIPKLIRILEPHLSIQQRMQLKEEGTYRGQKELYPSNLEPNEKPACADYVRQLVVGSVRAGRNHDYIVHLYIEEALANMNNIQAFQSRCLTQSMATSIAGLKKLQALSLDLGYGHYQSLHKIKNLKHLALKAWGQVETIHSLLLNSRSSLQSLNLEINSFGFRHDWAQMLPTAGHVTSQGHYLTALKSFSIQGCDFDRASVAPLKKAINFVRLRELIINHLPDSSHLLFQMLTELFSTASVSEPGVLLQSLIMDMGPYDYDQPDYHKQAMTDHKCHFLSSFSTLKTLNLADCGQYKLEDSINPGLPNNLLQAILKHKDLEKLSISYNGVVGGYQLPYLPSATVASLIDNLPHLKELNIAPEDQDHHRDALGEALGRGTNLELITFSHTRNWASRESLVDAINPLLHSVLKGFLSRSGISDTVNSRWEDHCKLKRVTVNSQVYEVASKFGMGGKGISKPENFTLPGNPKRQVMYRDITRTLPSFSYVGFDPYFTWLEKISKDLN